ncbi:MAG: branched-chain-amino acid aminotransferase [Deltaproteobacteria bacterium]|nr:MAG: branched-chain-amino acid aminotransferase [Deltaproteobacteria bacterium]
MSRLVLIDGVSTPAERAQISVYDRGFLYGDSVFETIRTYGGRLFALAEHIDRLARSASSVGIQLPVSTEQLAEETLRAVREAGNAESYARVMITRGSGPVDLDTASAEQPLRVVMVQPLTTPPAEYYRDGILVRCIETVRASDAAGSAKLGNYLASALALRLARDAGAAEALVVNRDGLVVEGPTSNVFLVQQGTIVTPPLEIGVLPGITRAIVIELAGELGLAVDFAAYPAEQVVESDEIFLTSSIREVIPVVQVDDTVIGDGKPGRITGLLHRAFRQRVGLGGELPHND